MSVGFLDADLYGHSLLSSGDFGKLRADMSPSSRRDSSRPMTARIRARDEGAWSE